jgi:hypothetical protein
MRESGFIGGEEFERRLARNLRFWGPGYAGEGAYIAVRAPRRGQGGGASAGEEPDLARRWLDVEGRVRRIEEDLANTFFGGDALPVAQVDFGPGIVPGLLGRPYLPDRESIWFDQRPFESPEPLAGLSLKRDTEFYRAWLGLTRRLLERSRGRYIVASADFGSAFDLLAALYRRENLLADIAEEPERVKDLLDMAFGWWSEAVLENHALIRQSQKYFSTWAALVSDRTFFTQGSEISVMLSGKTFAELSLPVLNREAAIHGHSLFTLDGDSMARHLPDIYRIGGLHAVNWGPTRKYTGPDSSYKDYTDPWVLEICRDIQEHSKLVLLDVPVWQVDDVMRGISRDGVFLYVDCTSQGEAEDFCARARRWTR